MLYLTVFNREHLLISCVFIIILILLNITCPLQRAKCASNMETKTQEKKCCPRAPHSLHPPSHPPPSSPGTQSRRSPRSWAGNLMFRSVNWGVLVSQSKTRAELLSQTCKGRSSLGNHMQIPCWGQWCGQSQRQGGRGHAQAKWSKALVCLDEYR